MYFDCVQNYNMKNTKFRSLWKCLCRIKKSSDCGITLTYRLRNHSKIMAAESLDKFGQVSLKILKPQLPFESYLSVSIDFSITFLPTNVQKSTLCTRHCVHRSYFSLKKICFRAITIFFQGSRILILQIYVLCLKNIREILILNVTVMRQGNEGNRIILMMWNLKFFFSYR